MRTGETGHRTIDIHVVIDVDFTPQGSPGPGRDGVTPPSTGRPQGYMLVTAAGGATQQGTGDVAFDAHVGDTIRFFVTSGSNNFVQLVHLQDIRQAGGKDVLAGFERLTEERMCPAPASRKSVLPARLVPRRFWFYQCKVSRGGSGTYQMVLALYQRDQDGHPRFAGLYPWDSRITVRDV